MPTYPSNKPLLILTTGDPAGIGPEVLIKSVNDKRIRRLARFVIVTDLSVFKYYRRALKVDFKYKLIRPAVKKIPADTDVVGVCDVSRIRAYNRDSRLSAAKSGDASLAYLNRALVFLKRWKGSALVTGPVCKDHINRHTSCAFRGHTDYLKEKTGAKRAFMCFIGGKMRLALFTHHVPLAAVPGRIKRGLEPFLNALVDEFRASFSIDKPKIALTGLNPHAGEGGLLGEEEGKYIKPAISKCRYPIEGPVPADAVFYEAYRGKYDLVIALYHDQALAPFKMMYRDSGVNLTLGLPFIRTSPDHGTAFDIAGSLRANAASFKNSIRLAAKLQTARERQLCKVNGRYR